METLKNIVMDLFYTPPEYVAGLLASLTILTLATWVSYQRLFNPLSRVPGPFFASLTTLWLVQRMRRLNWHKQEAQLYKKYGPVVRISPNEVALEDPSMLKVIYGAGSKFVKSEYYDVFGSSNPESWETWDLMTERDMKKYRVQRRTIGHVYSTGSIKILESRADATLHYAVDRIRRLEGEEFNVTQVSGYLAAAIVDTLTEMVFSERYGFLNDLRDDGTFAGARRFWVSKFWIGLLPKVSCVFRMIELNLEKARLTQVGSKERIEEWPGLFPWCLGKYNARRSMPVEGKERLQPDLCNKLLHLHETNSDFIEGWLKSMTMTNLGAGVDTIQISLGYMLAEAAAEPVQARIHAELDTARSSWTTADLPSYEDIKKLPYLQACIKESMRLHPVVGRTLPRVVPEGGMEIDGYYLPPKTVVGMNPYIIQRDRKIFGADADMFMPERWLAADQERISQMERSMLIFGGDSRSCPGKYVAEMVLSKAFATLLDRFHFTLTTKPEDFQEESRFILIAENLMMKAEPRLRKET